MSILLSPWAAVPVLVILVAVLALRWRSASREADELADPDRRDLDSPLLRSVPGFGPVTYLFPSCDSCDPCCGCGGQHPVDPDLIYDGLPDEGGGEEPTTKENR